MATSLPHISYLPITPSESVQASNAHPAKLALPGPAAYAPMPFRSYHGSSSLDYHTCPREQVLGFRTGKQPHKHKGTRAHHPSERVRTVAQCIRRCRSMQIVDGNSYQTGHPPLRPSPLLLPVPRTTFAALPSGRSLDLSLMLSQSASALSYVRQMQGPWIRHSCSLGGMYDRLLASARTYQYTCTSAATALYGAPYRYGPINKTST